MHGTARVHGRGLGGLKKRRRMQILVVAALALALATGLVGYALRDGISYFRSPSQLLEEPMPEGEVFRLGGLVKEGSITEGTGMHFSFVITDGAEEVAVDYIGSDPRPDLFKDGTGTVATGKMAGDRFEATQLLAKHDETYMPREVIDALKEQGVYAPPED